MASAAKLLDIGGAVIEIAAEVLEVPADSVTAESSPESVDSWDSLNHLKLITAIETRFDLRLPMAVVMELGTVKDLIDAVEKVHS